MQGTVKKIDTVHPYGWIEVSSGTQIFFHQRTVAPGAAMPALGDSVVFQLGSDGHGRTCATGVRKVTAAQEQHSSHADNPVRFGDNLTRST